MNITELPVRLMSHFADIKSGEQTAILVHSNLTVKQSDMLILSNIGATQAVFVTCVTELDSGKLVSIRRVPDMVCEF